MDREEKINYLIKMIEAVEGVDLEPDYFEEYTEDQLDDEMDWFDYLLTK